MCNVSRGHTELAEPMSHVETMVRPASPLAHQATSQVPHADSDRLVFLDALRLIAAVQMVQGHSLDAVMSNAYRSGRVFEVWSFTRGLTSTAFLLAAGLAFALVSADHERFVRGRPHRLRRASLLIAIGYLMHAPFGLFVGQSPASAWAELGIVDVLQCIGVGLLMLELVAKFLPSQAARGGFALCGCAVFFVVTPRFHALEPVGWARPVLHYLTSQGGSVFPLVPWLGFMFAGFGAGSLVLTSGLRTPRNRQVLGLLCACVLAFVLAALSHYLLESSDSRLGVAFQCLKLGLVFGFASLLALALRRVSRLPQLLTRLSAETLFLYVSHVVLLYAAGIGLKYVIGATQSLLSSLLLALMLFLACSAGALAYRRLRNALRAR